MRRLLLPCSLLLAGAVSAGCTDAPEPIERTEEPSPSSSVTPDEGGTTGAGPVAGSGAGLSPKNGKQWCSAVTADQLSALTGFEVTQVWGRTDGLNSCSTELPGLELMISWGSERTSESFEKYAAGWERPPGVFDVTELDLSGGRPAVLATQSAPQEAAYAGTVIDGRVVEVTVAEVIPGEETTLEHLGAVAEQILAVYAG